MDYLSNTTNNSQCLILFAARPLTFLQKLSKRENIWGKWLMFGASGLLFILCFKQLSHFFQILTQIPKWKLSIINGQLWSMLQMRLRILSKWYLLLQIKEFVLNRLNPVNFTKDTQTRRLEDSRAGLLIRLKKVKDFQQLMGLNLFCLILSKRVPRNWIH